MFHFVLLLLVGADVVVASSTALRKVHFESFVGPLSNMVHYNNQLYIGGRNMIHVLEMDLRNYNSVKTCNSTGCNNINKVLVIDSNTLVTCGTKGRCDVYNATSLAKRQETNELKVSTDINRPAQAMITETGHLVIAVTYGKGVDEHGKSPTDQPNSKYYDYALSNRTLSDLSAATSPGGLRLQIYANSSEDYIIKYKGSFQHNGFSYFITEQKEYVGANKKISKLVRLCQNDTKYVSYTDIIIQCEDDQGTIYDIVENAIITKTEVDNDDQMFIGSFSTAENSNDWVICSVELTELDRQIMNANKEFAYSPLQNDDSKKRRYLPDNRVKVFPDDNYPDDDFICKIKVASYSYAIGNITANMTAGNTLQKNKGVPTALYAAFEDDNLVIMVGTSKGQLILLNYNHTNKVLDEYSVTNVSQNKNIRAIYTKNDDVYVLSDDKVHLYSSTDCSEFKTCLETMTGRNPLCGWCVFEERATRKYNCSSYKEPYMWLSSLGRCTPLHLQPSGTPVNTEQNLEITASNISNRQPGDSYVCLFKGQEISYRKEASRNGSVFNCETPKVPIHTKAMLQLLAISSLNVTLAEAPFLFYECSTYKRCKECVSTDGSMCTWSLDLPACVNHTREGVKPGKEKLCPQLVDNSNLNFIPAGVNSSVRIAGSHLPNQTSSFKYWCYVNESKVVSEEASLQDGIISCSLKLDSSDVAKKIVPVYVKYGKSGFRKDLDDDHRLTVTVYNCGRLAVDCSHCKALNKSRYICSWCSNDCQHNGCDGKCPAPTIHTIEPFDGPIGGETRITLTGKNLGTKISDVEKVIIGKYECTINRGITYENDDFEENVPDKIECTTAKYNDKNFLDNPLPVKVTVNGSDSNVNVSYTLKEPSITRIDPSSGPMAGGTNVTIFGKNLGIGNRKWFVQFGSRECSPVKVIQLLANSESFTIECVTKNYSAVGNQSASLTMDGKAFTTELNASFVIVSNPNISGIEGKKGGFLSGGTILTVFGTDMHHANVGEVIMKYKEEMVKEKCTIASPVTTKCLVPKAPQSLRDDVMTKVNKSSSRRKRAACEGCIEANVTIKLDGVEKDFKIRYVQDPTIEKFGVDGNVLLYETEEHQLTIKGDALNLVTKKEDFLVTVGVANCTIIELTRDTLICSPPNEQPDPANSKNKYPEVNVEVGNIFVPVGYLLYKEKIEFIAIIAGAAGGAVLFILVIVIVIVIVKYRKVGKKAKAYEKSLADMEMEIKTVARQEFLDMHTTMSTVNKNLVEQGFPYHSYQQFACNVMFSVDYLWTEPVVSNGKMTDDERLKANRGMEQLESLIYNKFFLVSVISTMEKEKRFFVREKSNLAGNLCAVLMGRMDYLDEILKLLMNDLVSDTPQRKHKTLFRRCESITEKLLSNWLSLCLYPHIKSHSGSPLYLLHMATQKTMESGPIDAVTGDAKYTLSEEKLLKKWSSSMEEDHDNKDLKFEAKTLTLNVVVDNGDEIFKCKVLDCDTISQVKNKCLNQIYVNFPASRLPVGANDLALEWHEGFGGSLKLRDEDNTSKREGKWLRLNTLAHYNVKDESNMALIDPHSPDVDNQEDYVNLAHINMEGVCDGSIDSSQPLTLHDEQISHEYDNWHLVKKEEESSKQGKGAIAELYLNRLFTTKQSLMEYMRPLIDIILDHDKCPPPTKFLYDYLDELGDKYKVDADTVHAWKSHSYAIRVWASLMKMPNLLFDVSIPAFMEANLGIISQMFIESFSLGAQKFTKDTPPEKLIFHHETNHYRDRVKEFYKNVKVDQEDSDAFRQYMAEVNRLQQVTEFNKVSALYRLYKQLKPYFEDILESLATSKEASNLQLDRKLEQVMAIMEEDE